MVQKFLLVNNSSVLKLNGEKRDRLSSCLSGHQTNKQHAQRQQTNPYHGEIVGERTAGGRQIERETVRQEHVRLKLTHGSHETSHGVAMQTNVVVQKQDKLGRARRRLDAERQSPTRLRSTAQR